MTSNGLLQVVRELAEASRALVNGDPEPFKSHWSHADDVRSSVATAHTSKAGSG